MNTVQFFNVVVQLQSQYEWVLMYVELSYREWPVFEYTI